MRPLGYIQKQVLSHLQLDLYHDGCWDPIKPPWIVKSKHKTLRALESLVFRGLVIREQRGSLPPLYRLKIEERNEP